MKTKLYFLFLAILVVNITQTAKSQSELVNGYYDPVNDWFVFEWDRPEYGKTMTIYDPPNKVKPVIKGRVVFDSDTQEYIYNYEVGNQTGIIQSIADIVIKYMAPIYDAKAPSEDWYMNRYRGKDAWHWTNYPPGILPGETKSGFFFKSKGVPTIVNSVFLGGKRAIYSPPGDYDTDDVVESFDRVMKTLEEQYPEKFEYVVRKTIGPTAPPSDFKPLDFLNYIIDLKHQSTSLGWIRDKGIEQSLDTKLENAKKKIEQGNVGAAKNILEALINEVEAQGCESYESCPSGKHLTSEAYALLKYNVRYLIENL